MTAVDRVLTRQAILAVGFAEMMVIVSSGNVRYQNVYLD